MSALKRGCDLRVGRYSGQGHIYLLTSVVHGRQPLFSDWLAGRLVVDEFRRVEQEGIAQSLAWVVMPDHFHWLVELQNVHLPVLMCKTKSRTVRAVNDDDDAADDNDGSNNTRHVAR